MLVSFYEATFDKFQTKNAEKAYISWFHNVNALGDRL